MCIYIYVYIGKDPWSKYLICGVVCVHICLTNRRFRKCPQLWRHISPDLILQIGLHVFNVLPHFTTAFRSTPALNSRFAHVCLDFHHELWSSPCFSNVFFTFPPNVGELPRPRHGTQPFRRRRDHHPGRPLRLQAAGVREERSGGWDMEKWHIHGPFECVGKINWMHIYICICSYGICIYIYVYIYIVM